jgi:hypothetical protein
VAYEQRDNSGAVFVNDKDGVESRPDRTGTAMIGGKMYYISGWLKSGSKGPFLSLAFKPVEEKAKKAPPTRSELDEEIPF